jgi:hypothetical protein
MDIVIKIVIGLIILGVMGFCGLSLFIFRKSDSEWDYEDEEQTQYLEKWNQKHNKVKKEINK